MRILAKLNDGREVIAEFKNVTRFGVFAQAVASGSQRFNIWTSSEETLNNGEVVTKRTREVIFPSAIKSLTEVDAQGNPVTHVKSPERYGLYVVPNPRPEGVPTELLDGVEYPQHRDEENMRLFVFTNVTTGAKWFTDGRGENAPVTSWNEPHEDENDYSDDEGEPIF